MSKRDFMPKTQDSYLTWHDNYLSEATAHAAALGISAPDLAAITTRNADLHARATAATTAQNAAKAATSKFTSSIETSQQAERRNAKTWKLNANYTSAMGDELGIEGAEDSTDMESAKPNLKVAVKGNGVVEVAFNKMNAEGVRLYGQRDGESGWTLLARENYSPYVDNRPLQAANKPEIRKYKALFVIGREEVGLESDVVEATARA